MRRWLLWAPLVGFALLLTVAASGLFRPADRAVRSGMIGRPLPAFALPAIVPGKPGLSAGTMRDGRPRLVNVFASWCLPCIAEAPQLMELRRMGWRVDGVAIRDRAPALASFLKRNGDPYSTIGDDRASSVQLSLGSSGVPETFVVDGRGTIRHQHIGDIRPEDVPGIVAALEAAR